MSQYTPHARAALSLAYLSTQSAANGNLEPLAFALAMECAGDVLASLITARMGDLPARCTLAHKATAEAYMFAITAQLEQSDILRWRVANAAWSLAADLVKHGASK
jgi:hypothetical protein